MAVVNDNIDNPIVRRNLRKPKDVVDFSKVGGLNHHLKTLREVIIIPLLHGNIFSHFKIKAPRGVLFYGPPGTGKTLVAGALAAEINREGIGKVSFFQRKGADILDKWVGESEKNLRTLFEQASKHTPAIIFFDELDGLAPVRSERNDHIHSSVVATLLGLMDGLDNKPGVIVIGATNRIEALDPALRRPGRFDKELYFPLPGIEARKEIMQVHTNTWKYKLTPRFISEIADLTAGFCGSDLQALCSEAVLCCLRRIYPKTEVKGFKLKIRADTLKVDECDFLEARLNLVPSSFKQGQKMRNLNPIIKPLLNRQQTKILRYIHLLWPHFLEEAYKYTVGEKRYAGRILLIGSNMQGLNTHLVPSILKDLEHLPSFVYDTNLFDRIKLANFINVQCNFPAVILLSRIDEWWDYIDECDQHSIVSTLEDIHAGLPILTIASCKTDIPTRLHNFFYNNSTILIRIVDPDEKEREAFLSPLFFDETIVSLYSVLVDEKKIDFPVKKIKGENLNRNFKRAGRRKKKNKENIECDVVIGDISTSVQHNCQQKRKRKPSRHVLVKKIKLCTNSTYDLQEQMGPNEKGEPEESQRYDSLTSFQSLKKKQYFTRVLSDLLNQRSSMGCSYSSPPNDAMLYDTEPNPISLKGVSTRRKRFENVHVKKIYDLWKRASSKTTRNMAVAQLELVYDIISATININRNSFESLIEKLENLLRKIETSYQVTDTELQCP